MMLLGLGLDSLSQSQGKQYHFACQYLGDIFSMIRLIFKPKINENPWYDKYEFSRNIYIYMWCAISNNIYLSTIKKITFLKLQLFYSCVNRMGIDPLFPWKGQDLLFPRLGRKRHVKGHPFVRFTRKLHVKTTIL